MHVDPLSLEFRALMSEIRGDSSDAGRYAHSKEVNANGLRNRSGRRAATAMSAVRSRKNADESTLALAALCFAKAAVNACLQAERLQPRDAHWGASDA